MTVNITENILINVYFDGRVGLGDVSLGLERGGGRVMGKRNQKSRFFLTRCPEPQKCLLKAPSLALTGSSGAEQRSRKEER